MPRTRPCVQGSPYARRPGHVSRHSASTRPLPTPGARGGPGRGQPPCTWQSRRGENAAMLPRVGVHGELRAPAPSGEGAGRARKGRGGVAALSRLLTGGFRTDPRWSKIRARPGGPAALLCNATGARPPLPLGCRNPGQAGGARWCEPPVHAPAPKGLEPWARGRGRGPGDARTAVQPPPLARAFSLQGTLPGRRLLSGSLESREPRDSGHFQDYVVAVGSHTREHGTHSFGVRGRLH